MQSSLCSDPAPLQACDGAMEMEPIKGLREALHPPSWSDQASCWMRVSLRDEHKYKNIRLRRFVIFHTLSFFSFLLLIMIYVESCVTLAGYYLSLRRRPTPFKLNLQATLFMQKTQADINLSDVNAVPIL